MSNSKIRLTPGCAGFLESTLEDWIEITEHKELVPDAKERLMEPKKAISKAKLTQEKHLRLAEIASGAENFSGLEIVKKYPSTAAEHIRGLSKIVLDLIKEN